MAGALDLQLVYPIMVGSYGNSIKSSPVMRCPTRGSPTKVPRVGRWKLESGRRMTMSAVANVVKNKMEVAITITYLTINLSTLCCPFPGTEVRLLRRGGHEIAFDYHNFATQSTSEN